MMKLHKLVIGVAAAAMLTGSALAGSHSKTTLRVQTHYRERPSNWYYLSAMGERCRDNVGWFIRH